MEEVPEFVATKQYCVSVQYPNNSYMRLTLAGENVEIMDRDLIYVTLAGNIYVFTDKITGEPLRINKRLPITFYIIE
jgi:hypothetical protein